MTFQTERIPTLHRSALICLLMFCFLFGLPTMAQAQNGQGQRSPAEIEWDAQQKLNAQKKLNQQREQDIQKDTEKLLQLATELKQYVDTTTSRRCRSA